MSTKLKHQAINKGDNVVAIGSKCKAESCSHKAELMDFCGEHYEWFKWGLISRDGKRPTDFDKKYTAYMKRRAA